MRSVRITRYLNGQFINQQIITDEPDQVQQFIDVMLTDGARHPAGKAFSILVEELVVTRTISMTGDGEMQVKSDGERYLIINSEGMAIAIDDFNGGIAYVPRSTWDAKFFRTKELAEDYIKACNTRAVREGWMIKQINFELI